MDLGRTIVAALPLAAAVGVFGVLFGAAAAAVMDPLLAIGMSALVFSGSLQFALLGLLTGGAGPIALIATALALNTRHIVLAAVLRPRLSGSRLRRALQSAFIVDESFGLAIAAHSNTGAVLVASGALIYAGWLGGTVLGVLGARVVGMEGLAGGVFPILFIGLAAITARGRHGAARALIAAVAVMLLSLAVPWAYSYLPIAVALAVAIPSGRGT